MCPTCLPPHGSRQQQFCSLRLCWAFAKPPLSMPLKMPLLFRALHLSVFHTCPLEPTFPKRLALPDAWRKYEPYTAMSCT